MEKGKRDKKITVSKSTRLKNNRLRMQTAKGLENGYNRINKYYVYRLRQRKIDSWVSLGSSI